MASKSDKELMLSIKVSIEDLKKAMEQAEKIIADFAKALSNGIKLSIDTKALKKEVNSAINDFNSEIEETNKKNKKLKINVDGDKLKSNIKNAVREAITKINKEGIDDRKVHIKTSIDNSSINMSLSNLKKRLASQELRVNTGKAESDIVKLSTYMNQLSSKNVSLGIDSTKIAQAKTDVKDLISDFNQLKSKDVKIRIYFENKDIVNNLKTIDDLLKSIQKNSNINLKMTGSGGGGGAKNNLQSQVQQYRTLRQEARQFALEAEKAWTAGDKHGFEQNRQNFQMAMKDLADFSRQLGNLSAGREAGMYSNMLRSLQQTSPLYQDILNKVKQLKQEQKDLNNLISDGNNKLKQESSGSKQRFNKSGFMYDNIDSSAYAIRFFGRSSKGIGSAGEAFADFVSRMNEVSGGLGTLATTAVGTIAVLTGLAFAINGVVSAIGGLSRILGELANLVVTALKPGFELISQRDTTMLTTKAALKTSATIDGRKVTDEEASAESLFLFNRAVKEAAKSVLNFSDIQAAQQGALPMLLNKGMTPREAQDIIFGVAGVAKTGRLAPNQVLQETRDLAQGSITARTSQVANILGITNQDLAKFKGDADALYDYLMDKFKEYSAVLDEYAKTPVGAIEQLQETWGIAASKIVDEYGPLIVGIANDITKALGEFDENTGEFKLSPLLQELADGLEKVLVYATSCADAIYNMIQSIVGGNDPIEVMTNFIIEMIGTLTTLTGIILGVVKVFKGFWAVIKSGVSFFEALTKAAFGLGYAVMAVGAGLAGLATGDFSGVESFVQKAKDNFAEAGQALVNASDIKGQFEGTIQSGWTASNKKDSYKTYLGEKGAITKYLEDKLNIGKNKELGKGQDYEKMRGTAKDTEDEKARKKAIQDAQKNMKAHIQGLKEALKDHISELKETLAKNKIAFDEGFMSIKEYYEQKASIEREEAEAKLKEAQEEMEWVKKTPYLNEADREKELHKLNREINQYTRELNKTIQAQKEVAEITRQASENFGNLIDLHSNLFGDKMGNTPLNAQTTANMSNTEVLYRLFTQQGLEDNLVRGIIAAFMGESGRDLNTKSLGDKGTSYGIAQWHDERWTGLQNFASENASDINHILTQGSYFLHEIWTTEKRAFAQVLDYYNSHGKTQEAAVEAVVRFFERPRDISGESQARKKNLAYVNTDLENASKTAQNVVSGFGDALTTELNKYLGMPYFLGNDLSQGIDCSKLVQEVYKALGVSIARTADDQARDFEDSGAFELASSGYKPKKGDSVFMYFGGDYGIVGGQKIGHTGIYNGDGTITHASSGRGKVVTVPISDLQSGIVGYGDISKYAGIKFEGAKQIHMNKANTSETSSAYLKSLNNSIKDFYDTAASLEAFQLNKLEAQINKIKADLEAKINSSSVQGLEGEAKDAYIQQLTVMAEKQIADLTISVAERTLNYNLTAIKDNFEQHVTKAQLGRIPFSDFNNILDDYFNYFYNTKGDGGGQEGGIWGVFKYIDSITEKAKFYLEHGMNEAYQQAMQKIKQYKDVLKDLMKEPIDRINNIFDTSIDLFTSSNRFTPLQKEFGERELKAMQGQLQYNTYSGIEKNLRSLKTSEIERYNKGLITSKQLESELLEIDKQLWDTTMAKEKAKMMAEDYPDYLRDLKASARDALEDGLVTFLTDGITEADSLKDALYDLAETVLKEIQKISAKYIVKNLMNNLFGGWEVDNPETLHLKSAQGLDEQLTVAGNNVISALNEVATGIRNSGLSQIVGINSYTSTTPTTQIGRFQGYWDRTSNQNLGIFSSPWSSSLLNQNANKYSFGANNQGANNYSFDYASLGIQKLGESANMAGQQALPNFTQGIQNVSDNLANANVTTGAEQMATSMQTATTTFEGALQSVVTYIDSNLNIALQGLDSAAERAATALSTVGVGTGMATGGLIKGPGTSKSDSIPTMLSNGEFVISADSVKKYGTNFLEALNEGKLSKIKSRLPHFANGGLLNIAQDQTARGVSNFGKNMASNINNTANISVALVRDEQEGMRQLLKSSEGQKIMLDFSRKYAKFTSKL